MTGKRLVEFNKVIHAYPRDTSILKSLKETGIETMYVEPTEEGLVCSAGECSPDAPKFVMILKLGTRLSKAILSIWRES